MAERKYNSLTNYRLLHTMRTSPFYEEYGNDDSDIPYSLSTPVGWFSEQNTAWRFYFPPNAVMPNQGWKIHLSACPGDALKMLEIVSALLFELQVPFKHLASERSFRQSNMKYSNRSSSGKFVTIYPKSEDSFVELLEQLEGLLTGFEGPYVLSDVRYKKAPVFFRYGAFLYKSQEDDSGKTILTIEDNEGNFIEDKRLPYFTLPGFVSIPDAISEQVCERLNPNPSQLEAMMHPYIIHDSLHFSNGGGVYLAYDLNQNRQVILKESRPFAAYTSETENAIVRLRHERDVLVSLQGLTAVPKYIDYFEIDGHEFLVESCLEGVSLQSWIASNFPFSLDSSRLHEYQKSALGIAKRIRLIIDEIHDCDIAIMDISAKNFIIDSHCNPQMIDFEACRELNGYNPEVLGTPGFIPFAICSNRDRDAFGLASLFMYMFWPSWVSAFSPTCIVENMKKIERYYSAEVSEFLSEIIYKAPDSVFAPRFEMKHLDLSEWTLDGLIVGLVEGIKRTRMPDSANKRLYPGDATQFLHGITGMLDIETGAAGIALILHRAGCATDVDEEWISSTIRSDITIMPFHGLLRGLVGVVSVLVQLGRLDLALDLLPEKVPDHSMSDLSVRTGLSGTVLALCDIYSNTNDKHVLQLLSTCADLLYVAIQSVFDLSSPGSETGNAVGLFDGWSGVALACHELSIVLPDETRWSRVVNDCLDREISELSKNTDGTLYVDYAGVNYGYLSEGIAGIAFALARCKRAEDADIIRLIQPGLSEYLALNGGLFRGIAGKAVTLWTISPEEFRADISLMMGNALESFLFRRGGERAVYALGDGGACLSADYSTGAAGIAGILLSFKHGGDLWFPVSLH